MMNDHERVRPLRAQRITLWMAYTWTWEMSRATILWEIAEVMHILPYAYASYPARGPCAIKIDGVLGNKNI